jgi:signal transduction histidine kinase
MELIEDTLFLVYAKAERAEVKIRKRFLIDHSNALMVDPELIKTCLLNIFQNAFHAMAHGGTLTVEAVRKDDSIRISVSDTGVGLEEEFVGKVFDQFFTTRERGLGLGLAMTKRVIEEHGGSISFTSRKGEGSTVDLSLPITK